MRARSARIKWLALSAIAAASIAGCGSSGSGTGADPATAVPSSAPLYIGLQTGPGGDALTAAKKLTHLAEPYGSLIQALLAGGHSQPQFKRDIKPWIGPRAGVFISAIGASALQGSTSAQALMQGGLSGALSALGAGSFGSGSAQGAIVLDTSDVSGARSFLNARAHEQQAHTASYRGVSYQVSPSGAAEGIVDKFAVIGSESGIKGVIDTVRGGASVKTAPGYGSPPADAIATAYVRPEALAGALRGAQGASAQGVLLLSQLFAGSQSASLSVTSTASSISAQGEIESRGATKPLFGQESARALGALPGGAWMAAGVGDTGANLGRELALLRAVASFGTASVFSSLGGPGIEKALKALASSSARLQRSFSHWAGPAGVFVSGTGLFNLEAGLVIASNDPAASRAAVNEVAEILHSAGASVGNGAIAGADAVRTVSLPGFPAILYIASGQGKFIVGLGQATILGVLSPASTLSTSPSYAAAAKALGEGIEPSLIVEFPTMLGFLEGLGLTQSPAISPLLPYLKSLGTLTAGAVSHGNSQHFKLVLGLASTAQGG